MIRRFLTNTTFLAAAATMLGCAYDMAEVVDQEQTASPQDNFKKLEELSAPTVRIEQPIEARRRQECRDALASMASLIEEANKLAKAYCITKWNDVDDRRRQIDKINGKLRECSRNGRLDAATIDKWIEHQSRQDFRSNCVDNTNKRFCGQEVNLLKIHIAAAEKAYHQGCTDEKFPESVEGYYMSLTRLRKSCLPENLRRAKSYVDALTHRLEYVYDPYCTTREKIAARCPEVPSVDVERQKHAHGLGFCPTVSKDTIVDVRTRQCMSRWDVADCLDRFGYWEFHVKKTFCSKDVDVIISNCMYPDGTPAGTFTD